MTDRRLLERGVPVALLNKEAQKEKLAVPPHVLLQYYFTRKPLISARLALAGALLSASDYTTNDDFLRKMGLDRKLARRAYTEVPNELINTISRRYPSGVTVLDPFAGSGTIPLEAMRLGLDVVALDYSPVAYLLMKGTLEYPLVYGGTLISEESGESRLLSDVKRYAKDILLKLEKEFNEFYPTHGENNVRAYINAWAVECPFCGGITPLVHSWSLDVTNEIHIRPTKEGKSLRFELAKGSTPHKGNIKRNKATCLLCTQPLPREHIIQDIQQHEREILLAVYLDDGTFALPNEADYRAIEFAQKRLKHRMSDLGQYIPSESMPDDIRSAKYLKYWYRLFSPRQLLIHTSFVKEIRAVIQNITKENRQYANAIGTYLYLILSKHLIHNSRAAYWHKLRLSPASVFANRTLSMMWVHSEVNPFAKSAGSLENSIQNILSGLEYIIQDRMINQGKIVSDDSLPHVEIVNGSLLSWRPKRKFSVIVTDPPYYDDVPYPEVMQFYQVWANKILGDIMDIPATPSTNEELSVGRTRDNKVYESRMEIAIKRIHDLLEENGILALFYAHKSIDGWKYVLDSLQKAGFVVTSTHTLRTESGAGVISRGKSSVFHSLLLTARKRLEDKTISITDLEKEVRKKMDARYDELTSIYGSDRLNLMVAASGIVIETITTYSEIESFTKNTAEYALETGQQYLIELFAKKSLDIDYVDPKTMLYVWLRYSPTKDIPFSEFNQTLKALGLEEAVVSDLMKKDKSKVRLLDFSERGALEVNGSDPVVAASVIDAVHLVLRGYIRGGIAAATPLIRESSYGEETLLHTIEGLAKLALLRPGYSEGETCIEFLDHWGIHYDRDVKYKEEKLDKYLTEDEE